MCQGHEPASQATCSAPEALNRCAQTAKLSPKLSIFRQKMFKFEHANGQVRAAARGLA